MYSGALSPKSKLVNNNKQVQVHTLHTFASSSRTGGLESVVKALPEISTYGIYLPKMTDSNVRYSPVGPMY